jgi:small subunit ribosomal protein S16
MLAIRLSRTGSTKRPFFRVVVSDSRKPSDGRFVEILGHYEPRREPVVLQVDRERVAYWLKVGARPTDTVRTLLARPVPAQPAAAEPKPAHAGGATGPSAVVEAGGPAKEQSAQ